MYSNAYCVFQRIPINLFYRQEITRKKTIHDLMEKGDERDRELKRAQRDAVHRQAKIHMAEMMTVLRAAYTSMFLF